MKHPLPPELEKRLKRLIRRVRILLLLRGLMVVVAVAIVAILTIMASDAAVVLVNPIARWSFSLAGLLFTLATAWSLLLIPLIRPLSLTRMARVLETRHPHMQERISSALELAACGGCDAERASLELVNLLTQDAKSELAGVSPQQEFSVRSMKPFLAMAIAALLVLGVLFTIWPQQSWLLFLRALAPHREFDTLQASALQIVPGDAVLLAGSPLLIQVTAPSRHGLRAEIHFKRSSGRAVVERLKQRSELGVDPVLYVLDLPVVEESFEYRVYYGNAVTRPYTVRVFTAPNALETRVSFDYPDYTGLVATQTVGVVQEIVAIAGTRVRIEADLNRKCYSALCLNDLQLPNSRELAAAGVWEQTLTTNTTGVWTLALRDPYGFTNRLPQAAYRVLPDCPPVVTLTLPEKESLVLQPCEQLVITGTAQDDFGFSARALVLTAKDHPEIHLSEELMTTNLLQCALSGSPDLQALYDQGIRSLTLCFRVADNLPPEFGGPQIRESRQIKIHLKNDAQTLRDQVRDAMKKMLETQLRKAAQELHEAANRVAQEKGSYDRPDMTDKAVAKLEQAREDTLKAEERLRQAMKQIEQTPFAAFAEKILDTHDAKVEPAFQKLEQIPLTSAQSRKQAGEEAEQALREAANTVNQLANDVLQTENRKQEALSRVAEVAQREQALAQQANAAPMEHQQMQEWVNRQNQAEQKMGQAKQQLEDAHVQASLEEIRLARDAMLLAQRAMTPEQQQALKKQNQAQELAEAAVAAARNAAEQAHNAAEQAVQVAEKQDVTDPERTVAAKAAQQAEQISKEATRKAQQAEEMAETVKNQPLQQAVQQAGAAAKLSGEAAELAQQALQRAQQSDETVQAQAQARESEKRAQQAQALAQRAAQQIQAIMQPVDAQQLAAAAKAREIADRLLEMMENDDQQQALAWHAVQTQLSGKSRPVIAGQGMHGVIREKRAPLNQDWIRFQGEVGSEAYKEMLMKTPAEYRELVKSYFEELAREGSKEQK